MKGLSRTMTEEIIRYRIEDPRMKTYVETVCNSSDWDRWMRNVYPDSNFDRDDVVVYWCEDEEA